jgi:hypothetical protein
MADEKGTPAQDVSHEEPPRASIEEVQASLPSSWMYKSLKLGGKSLPWYASPQVQIILVAFVCFMCPGKRQQTICSEHWLMIPKGCSTP